MIGLSGICGTVVSQIDQLISGEFFKRFQTSRDIRRKQVKGLRGHAPLGRDRANSAA